MGAKTSQEMLKALELVRQGITPYAAVRVLAAEGLTITEQAIFQSRAYKAIERKIEDKELSEIVQKRRGGKKVKVSLENL